jgi:hypothetical protein
MSCVVIVVYCAHAMTEVGEEVSTRVDTASAYQASYSLSLLSPFLLSPVFVSLQRLIDLINACKCQALDSS